MIKRKTDRRGKRGFLVVIAVLITFVFVAGLLCYMQNRTFEVTFYSFNSPKTEERIRIVDLSDLHNWTFGEENRDLVNRIRELSPDLITITGDMVMKSDSDISVAVSLCRQLVEIAPVFYTFGNHENELVFGDNLSGEFLKKQENLLGLREDGSLDLTKAEMKDSSLLDSLTQLGVVVLNDSTASVNVKGHDIDLAGIAVPSGYYFPYANRMVENMIKTNPERIKILLNHYPSLFKVTVPVQDWLQYDVAFCGHVHGGIVRLPGLGGVFYGGWGPPWFQGYDSGMVENEQGRVVISRGLGNSHIVPRINNPPELIVMDIY